MEPSAQCLAFDSYSTCTKYSLSINGGWILFNMKVTFSRKQMPTTYFLAGPDKASHGPHVSFLTKVWRMTHRRKRWLYCSKSNKLTDKWYFFENAIWNFLKMFHYDWLHWKVLFGLTYFVFLIQSASGHDVLGAEISGQPLKITYRLILGMAFPPNFASSSVHNDGSHWHHFVSGLCLQTQ